MSRFWWTYFGALRGYGYDDVSRIRIVGDRSLIAPVRRFRLYQAYFLVS